MSHTEFAPGLKVQGLTPPLRLADYRLAAFDMDSTLINLECVDEIASAVGKKAEVAAITEAAMRGEIADYKESLRQRVALLRACRCRPCRPSTTSACSSTPAWPPSWPPARPPA
jgi:phosphoserine phosphatase